MVAMTIHSIQRAAQRGLSQEGIDYVITYGQRFHRAGAMIYYLRRKDVPIWDQRDPKWQHLVGTAVVLTRDGRRVITTWRNLQTGLKRIRCKPEYSVEEDFC